VIGTALEQLDEQIGERAIHLELASDLPLVRMDFVLIVQVLANLIDNAHKYSPAKSPIEIQALCLEEFLEIRILDRGIGIPTEDLNRVFDKFYRIQRPDNVSGTGLGLSICKGIIEAHNGNIRAENREGGGTVITLALPLEGAEGR
jgi:two-component system sensor histidine kinase KdpD